MGGSDGNAQVRANYQSKIIARVWPWSLTVCLLLAGCVYNAYHLYKLIHTNEKGKIDEIGKRMTHEDFQHQIAMKLLENPQVFGRKRPSTVSISTTSTGFTMPQENKHRLVRMSKRGYCNVCKITKERPARRQALGEIDTNGKKRRIRGSESWYACVGCEGSYCCQTRDCFTALHS